MAQEVYIGPDESVVPCCLPHQELVMGNLKSASFLEIWSGSSYRKLRRGMFEQELKGYCANCKLYDPLPDDASYQIWNFEPEVVERRSLLKRVTQRVRKILAPNAV